MLNRRAVLVAAGAGGMLMLVPENPVVGGNVLRRKAIQSPNFVHNVSGWQINQDGSAEFNNVVIRNGQVVSGTALYYSGTPAAGNLVASVSAAPGTDSFGNAYLAGQASYAPSNLGVNFAVAIGSNSLQLYSGPSGSNGAGPWTLQASLALDTAGATLLLNVPAAGFQVSGGPSVIGSGLQVQNSPGARVQENITDVVATNALGIRVAGDTFDRFRFNGAGAGAWGSGAAAQDSNLLWLSANRMGFTTCDLAVHTVGRGLQVAEGTNAKQGRGTLAAGSLVVATTAVTASSIIYPGMVTPSASAGALFVSSVTVGTGFTIKSTNAADTSVVGWRIDEPG